MVKKSIEMVNKWLEKIDDLWLVGDVPDFKVTHLHVDEHRGFERRLYAYKKRLARLEMQVIKKFYFPKHVVDIFDDYLDKNEYFSWEEDGVDFPVLYITGKNDMRIGKKKGKWELISFGFGWMHDVHPDPKEYAERDLYEPFIEHSNIYGYRYEFALSILDRARDFLYHSLLLLKDILTKKYGEEWKIQE